MDNVRNMKARDLEELCREFDIGLVFADQIYEVSMVTIPEEGNFGNDAMVEITFRNGAKNWYDPSRNLGVAIIGARSEWW